MNTKKHILSFGFFRLLLLAVFFCFSSQFSWATINNNTPSTSDYLKNTYYTGANGKSGSALFTAISTISEGVHYSYNKLTYDNLWTAYATSDVYPTGHAQAGKIWDMYATCYYSTSDHASTNGGPECSNGINREHSMPKSWWGNSGNAYESNNQGCDLVHVVPTDAYVNKVRDNYAFGEVQTATYTFAISKQGTSKTTLSLTSGSTVAGTSVSVSSGTTVFEPADEYKGDFARIYMYMRARYPSLNLAQQAGGALHFTTTTSAANATNYGLTNYSVILLMKWHRQDPVSQKEIDRNNAIEKIQGNRNPFVDYPCLAEYLWGTLAGQEFNPSTSVGSFESGFVVGTSDGCPCAGPTITLSTSSLTMDPTASGSSSTKTFTVTGANLTSQITITNTSGDGCFSVSPSSITSGYNGTTTITVTYSPTTTGNHSATFTVASTGADSKTVTVTGTCAATKTVQWKVNNSDYTTGDPTTSVVSGGKVSTLPTNPSVPSGCSGKTFVGWSATALATATDTKPTDLFTDVAGSPTISANTTFYAVFATVTGGSGGTVTETMSTTSPYVSQTGWTASAGGTYTTSGNYGDSSPSMKLSASNQYIQSATMAAAITSVSYWYKPQSATGTLKFYVSTDGSSFSELSGEAVSFSSSSTADTKSIILSAGNNYRAIKIVYTKTTSNVAIDDVSITYGTAGSTTGYITTCSACTPSAPSASFAESTKTAQVGGSVNNEFTTNSDGVITYSSSNTSVATVNSSTGAVTIEAAGTTRITASVAASTCYTAASAYYDLTVYDFHASAATDVTCSSFTANWTSAGASDYTVDVYTGTSTSTTVSRDTTISYDFTTGMQWAANDVSGTSNIWTNSATYGNVGKGASGTASESWLISPTLDFSNVTTASLAMNHTVRYGATSHLSVKYSLNGGSSWSNATISNWSDVGSWTFVDATGDLSALCGQSNVKLAFVYTCTASSFATWEIKTFVISGTYDKTTTSSSVTHVTGYPKVVTGTSNSVTGLDAETTYHYTVTPNGGSASDEIDVTTTTCAPTTYTITWKDGDGNTLKTEDVTAGSTPSYSGSTPTKTATAQYTYTFNNSWTPTIVAASANATYTAQFNSTPRSYTVTLNTNSGTINAGNVTSYTYGTGATLPTNVTRTGYTFGGWYENSGFTGSAVTTISTTATGNKTYYAKWTATTYTISYTLNDGSVSPANPTTYTIESSAITLNNPTKDCYTFSGWTGTNGSTPQTTITIPAGSTGNRTYTANYTIIPYTVKAVPDDASHGSTSITVQ